MKIHEGLCVMLYVCVHLPFYNYSLLEADDDESTREIQKDTRIYYLNIGHCVLVFISIQLYFDRHRIYYNIVLILFMTLLCKIMGGLICGHSSKYLRSQPSSLTSPLHVYATMAVMV